MRLVAKKPCSFGGKKFFIGDEVPANLVHNPNKQIAIGTLSKLNGSADAEPIAGEGVAIPTFMIPVYKEDSVYNVFVTNEELVVFTDIKQNPGKKAEEKQKIADTIKEITSNDLLILLNALDGRSVVTGPVMERVNELAAAAEAEAGETEVEAETDVETDVETETTEVAADEEVTPESGE